MWVFCGHQTLTSEHKLCGWSIKLVRYSNNHDNSDVWVVYEHRNKFVSDLNFTASTVWRSELARHLPFQNFQVSMY